MQSSTRIQPLSSTPFKMPLTTRELVADDQLRMIARGEPTWWCGEISAGMQSLLTTALPTICGDLLAYRKLADSRAIPALQTGHPDTMSGRDVVSDETLHLIVQGDPFWPSGRISFGMQASLVTVLQDICNELLVYRLAEDARVQTALCLREKVMQ